MEIEAEEKRVSRTKRRLQTADVSQESGPRRLQERRATVGD